MSTISPYLDDVATVFESLRDLQRDWPVSLYLRSDMKPAAADTFSTYVANPSAFPWTLRDAFPGVSDRDVGRLATACALLFHVVITCDNWMDASSRFTANADPIRVQALCFHGYRLLGELFPAGSPFWSRCEAFMHEFVTACVLERTAVDEGFPWPSLDEARVRQLVTGRNALARIVVAGLVALSGDERLYEPLIASVDRFMFGFQMVDDVQDWREDLRSAAPSLLLLRCARAHPGESDERTVGARLFHDGFIEAILAEAIAQYDGALSVAADLAVPKWHGLVTCKRGEVDETLRDVAASIHRMLETARSRPKVEFAFDGSPGARQALERLLAQWRGGFGEARHLLRAARDDGSADVVVRGDVFARTLLLDALLDAAAAGAAQLDPVIESETALVAACANGDGSDGWRYFPDLRELPPDAETLGSALAVLVRSRGAAFAERGVEAPLGVLFGADARSDGAVTTWIVPPVQRTALHERQAAYVALHLNSAPDAVVTATLLHALIAYDRERFRGAIERGARYVVSACGTDGLWSSPRYKDVYYPTYVCSRFLRAAGEGALVRCAPALLERQGAGGGWGLDGAASDPLSTALAMLAVSGTPDSTWAMRAGAEFLEHADFSADADVEFIAPATRAAPTLISRMEASSSKTVAIAFALRALIRADAGVTA